MNNNKTSGCHIISRRSIYLGRLIDLGIESVSLPNGVNTELEIIRHPGGGVALAINSANEVCLLRQYRHAANGWIWELPGGLIEADEDPLNCAQRELREEAGVEAAHWEPIMSFWSTPGFCTEKLYLFYATELSEVATQRDPDEVLEVHWLPLSEALQLCDRGDISDAKTLLGLYALQREKSLQ